MKTSMKKFLSLLLALSMVLSLMSVSVFADDEEEPVNYTITFDANGGEGEMAAQTVGAEKTQLTANSFTREGYRFDGWNTAADGSGAKYADKAEVTPAEDMTLYAQWVQQYSVSFDANADDVTNSYGEKADEMTVCTVDAGKSVEIPHNGFVRQDYVFTGWLDEGTGEIYQTWEYITPTEDVVLMAQWQEVIVASADGADADVVVNETDKEVTVYTAAGLKWVANMTNLDIKEVYDKWNWFGGWWVKLGNDIDLNDEYWTPIGNYCTFDGNFDGQNHTISNFREHIYAQDEACGAWLKNPTTFGYYGLFGIVNHDAIIKNLTIDGVYIFTEDQNIGVVAGLANGGCTFDNITIRNCELKSLNTGCGGVVGASWNFKETTGKEITFRNITVEDSNILTSTYEGPGTSIGGLLGQMYCSWNGKLSAVIDNCMVAAQVMPLNDVVSNYTWYFYRDSGMLIGYISGADYDDFDASKYMTVNEVEVIYGPWNQQRYCEFHEAGRPSYAQKDEWKFWRIDVDKENTNHPDTVSREAGISVIADMNQHFHYDDESHDVLIPFDQLSANGTGGTYSARAVRAIDGVHVTYDDTIDHTGYPVWTWANGLTSATARFDEEGTDTATDSDIEIVGGKVFASVEYNGATYTTYAEPYTLSFVDGGTTLQTIPAVDGQLPAPNAPSKEGYTFTGWSPALVPVTGNATYTAQFDAVDAANTETGESGKTVTTSEGEFEPISETEQQKVDFTVTTSEEFGVKTEVVEQTTTTGTVAPGADTATYTVTVETTTITTTTDAVGEKTTTASAGTPETTAVVTLTKTETTTVTNSTELEDINETVSAIVSAAEANVVTTDAVKVAEIAEKLLDMVREDEKFDTENKNTTIAVALTLEPTLIEVATETVDVEGTPTEVVTGITFDVKPMIQAKVTVGEVVVDNYITEATDRVVANAQLTGEPITVKLPITGDFVVDSAKSISVKHIHDDGTIDVIPGEIKGSKSDGYYVEVQVTEFSSFEIVPSNKVYATFDPNYAGSTKSVILYTVGDAITVPTVARGGYDFAGWSPDVPATATESATYTAQWSAIVYDDDDPAPTTTITDEETPLSAFPIFYVDVAENAWYHDAIAYVTALDLMNGVGDDRFAPNANTTRGMVAVVMMRLAQGEAVDLNSFFDVADDAYYAEAAAWAVENGVYVGYDDGSFRGELNILREQFAAVLYRYATAKGYDVSGKAELGSFTDSASVSGYAADAMAWAVESGIIEGVGDNLLDPLGNATRAQLATMLMRFHALYTAEV